MRNELIKKELNKMEQEINELAYKGYSDELAEKVMYYTQQKFQILKNEYHDVYMLYCNTIDAYNPDIGPYSFYLNRSLSGLKKKKLAQKEKYEKTHVNLEDNMIEQKYNPEHIPHKAMLETPQIIDLIEKKFNESTKSQQAVMSKVITSRLVDLELPASIVIDISKRSFFDAESLDFYIKNNRPFNEKEIAESLNKTPQSISRTIKNFFTKIK